jgi:hypothetical protein
MLAHFGSWPDQTHIAAKDVPKLRYFVQLESSYDPAHAGNPGIGPTGDRRAANPVRHSAQLQHRERPESSSYPLLDEEYRALGIQSYR